MTPQGFLEDGDSMKTHRMSPLFRSILPLLLVGVTLAICRAGQGGGEYIPEAVGHFLCANRGLILQTSERFQLPAEAIAGVISAEMTLNHGLKDDVEDAFLTGLLVAKNSAWWRSWYAHCNAEAERATVIHNSTGKWPATLILEGYVVSFGPAQITPRTLFQALKAAGEFDFESPRFVKDSISGLLDAEHSVRYVALILNFELSKFSGWTPAVLPRHLGVLGTLYSFGGDRFCSAVEKPLSSVPVYTFGSWIQEHSQEIHSYLSFSQQN
jgi:hypothetical protein